jgi:hypothetical protein
MTNGNHIAVAGLQLQPRSTKSSYTSLNALLVVTDDIFQKNSSDQNGHWLHSRKNLINHITLGEVVEEDMLFLMDQDLICMDY